MIFLLPTFNATLHPCPASRTAMEPHARGRFCGHCQRVVQDFSQSAHPTADLAAARAASPDGRVCGSFRTKQVMAPPTLTRRLKWFLLALVLVVGQGLTAQQALAQVRSATLRRHSPPLKRRPVDVPTVTQTIVSGDVSEGMVLEGPPVLGPKVYAYVGQMPTFRGGGMSELSAYIQQQVRRSPDAGRVLNDVEGRLFVGFTVGNDGLVRDAKLVKGLHPVLDAETLRVVQALTGFEPGKQNGQAVAVSLTVPVTFRSD